MSDAHLVIVYQDNKHDDQDRHADAGTVADQLSCYNSGENTEHVRMDNAANSFCNDVGNPGNIAPQEFVHSRGYQFDATGGLGFVTKIRMEAKEGCEWTLG
ncbi:hypothetical protein Hte_012635 [Hypoxylon texense]